MIKQLLFLTAFILLAPSLLAKAIPAWVKNEPVDPAYFSSIVCIDKRTSNYKDKARDDALKNIAMQITVTVSANLSNIVSEISNEIRSEFISTINTSTTTKLANIEIVDSYDTKNKYWVYYRLNKEQYYKQRRQSRDQAVRYVLQSLDIIDLGKSTLNDQMLWLIEGLDKITEFLDMDLETELNGRQINIFNEALTRLRRIVGEIRLTVNEPHIDMTSYVNESNVVNISLSLDPTSHNHEVDLSNLPLRVSFIKGKGILVSKFITDRTGSCPLTVQRIQSPEHKQSISISLDKSYYIGVASSILVKEAIVKMQFPGNLLDIDVRRPRILLLYHIDGKPDNDGFSKIYSKCLEWPLDPATDHMNADYMIEITIDTHKGSYITQFNQNSYFASATVTARECNSKVTFYSNTITQIKGSDNDVIKARAKAISNSGAHIVNEELPRIFMSHIFND